MKRIPVSLASLATALLLLFACHRTRTASSPEPPPQKSQSSPLELGSSGPATNGGQEGGVAGGVLGGVLPSQAPRSGNPLRQSEAFDRSSLVPASQVASADEVLVFESEERTAKKERFRGDSEKDDSRGGASGEGHPVTQGTLRAMKATGEPLGDFPLRRTEVRASIGGYLARTTVEQVYGNPYREVIEASYVFPLGNMAAVSDFVMEVGGRRIVGVVRPREEAERIYAEARSRGQTASLLTQERPNIFTQNVANIEPGGTVAVTLTTFERLRYERGTYEYVFPMVVGPRYIPGSAAAPERSEGVGGGGWAAPTDAVPDAHRITPPVLKPGERSGHDIDLAVELDAGIPLGQITSVAHKVDIRRAGPSAASVRLSEADAIPNRDFVLRWTVDASKMQFGVLPHRVGEEGFFTLMVQPPLMPPDDQVTPREITFLLDISGSMGGLPIETSKGLVREVLDRLRPEDAFNIVVFASGNGQLWEGPREGTPANLREAKRYLESLAGGGGTEMLAGLRRAVEARHDPRYLQMFVFCTDGYIGDEERILAFVEKERRGARFFAFGIGSSVNRYLIEGLGSLGGGKSMVVLPREEGQTRKAAERFFDCIDSPVLVDAEVDWNGLPVRDVYPSRLGDLFAGGTLDLVGRYDRPASGTAYVTGRVGTRRVRFPVRVNLPARSPAHPELAPVWARHRIADLSEKMLGASEEQRGELVGSITDLAVRYRLMSAYTAFVAVDASRLVGDGTPVRILQPVEMPEGVRYEGIFGGAGAGPGAASVSPEERSGSDFTRVTGPQKPCF